jgi:hypothetical protein
MTATSANAYDGSHASDGKAGPSGTQGKNGFVGETQINSKHLTNDGSLTVYIPPIHIQWDCFAVDTLIMMSDGSQKRIDEIIPGDFVATDKEDMKVISVVKGQENHLIHLETEEGSELRVTAEHPCILADNTVIRAEALRAGMRLRSGDGSLETIKWVYAEDYSNGIVYKPGTRRNGKKRDSERPVGRRFCLGG